MSHGQGEPPKIPTWAERICENCAHWSITEELNNSGLCRYRSTMVSKHKASRCSNHETELEADLRLQARYDDVVSKTAGLNMLMGDAINKARIKQLEDQVDNLRSRLGTYEEIPS